MRALVSLSMMLLPLSLVGCPPMVESPSAGGTGGTVSACEDYCGDAPEQELQTSCSQLYQFVLVQCDTAPARCHPLPTTHPLVCAGGRPSHPYCCPSE